MEDWLLPLQQGHLDVAWDRFPSRHRRLIFAAIRHYTQVYDDGMELFADLCAKLRADGMRRLRERAEDPQPRARFSTWLVAVVRHAAADWFRHRDGRHRISRLAEALPSRQRRIFQLVFVDRRSHGDSYELLRLEEPALPFGQFLADLRATYRALTQGRRGQLLRELGPPPPPDDTVADPLDPAESAERRRRLQAAMEGLAPEDRVAAELYVIEGLPAEQVARILGLPSAKAVYSWEVSTAGWRPGESEAAALAGAQRALLREPGHEHPFYWAGFVLTGSGLE